jgi:hypothetical protein
VQEFIQDDEKKGVKKTPTKKSKLRQIEGPRNVIGFYFSIFAMEPHQRACSAGHLCRGFFMIRPSPFGVHAFLVGYVALHGRCLYIPAGIVVMTNYRTKRPTLNVMWYCGGNRRNESKHVIQGLTIV